jgi:hypothetical protein
MHSELLVIYSGIEIPVTGRPANLLRLLVLHNGQTVRKTTIANLNGTSESSVGGKVRDLRDYLKAHRCPDLIETMSPLGFRVSLFDDWQIDACQFLSVTESLVGAFDETVRLGPEAASDQVGILRSVLSLWNANPAEDVDPKLEEKYKALKVKAENHLIKARLSTKNSTEIREAIQELEYRCRSSNPEEVEWKLLLLAYDALGNPGQGDLTIERIDQYYRHHRSSTPATLDELIKAIKRGDPHVNPFRINESTPPPPPSQSKATPERLNTDEDTLHAVCSILGITTASHLRLEGSHLTPLACIRRTRKRLYFTGVLASKWVIEPAVRSEFSEMLARLDANEGDARFLIINPKGEGFRRLSELRNGRISTESVEPLRRLAKEYPSLQVRVYEGLPAFRIVVIDDDVVSFSPYRLAAAAYLKTDRGWEAPHVALDPLAPYPLAEAFELLFLETWNRSEPLGDD